MNNEGKNEYSKCLTQSMNGATQQNQWRRLFDDMFLGLDYTANIWKQNPELILTESDLQSILFQRFAEILKNDIYNELYVHSEPSFFERNS